MKDDFKSGSNSVGEINDELLPGEVLLDKQREVKCVMIKDGEYKYVYADTGEDVK